MFLKILCLDGDPHKTVLATVDGDGVETELTCVTNVEMNLNAKKLEVVLTCYAPGLELLVPIGAVKVVEKAFPDRMETTKGETDGKTDL